MTSDVNKTSSEEEMTAEEFEVIKALLANVPASDERLAGNSTWVSRRRREFDLSGQYGDPP